MTGFTQFFRPVLGVLLPFAVLTMPAVGQERRETKGMLEEVFVTGGRDELQRLSGSATLIEETEISQFVTTDLNAMLTKVPGVYIRQEDGFGLRPNINLRGTSSDRSSKITIMEDGILIGPAPYSAPAAYYVPNVSRMRALEVSKGPAAIRYGPHTVGGAINFVTRGMDSDLDGEVSLAAGSDGFERYRGFYGQNFDNFGFWVDALRYGSDGFKLLDSGGDTGFVRNDVNAKLRWSLGDKASLYQEFNLKLGYADEDADETYLGLTDEDFEIDPDRRYAASALDNFQSDRQQIQLIHLMESSRGWKWVNRVYHHEFDRAWNKFDGIIEGPEVNDVLSAPVFFQSELALLRGERDSSPLSAQRIDITNNDRSFSVSGIESELLRSVILGKWEHEINVGVRYHEDEVMRDHQQRGYFMQSGELVFDGVEDRPKKAFNVGESEAFSLFLLDSITHGAWRVDLGLRLESIDMFFREEAGLSPRVESDTQTAVLPGVGVFFELNSALGVLAGINRGFSPKAPSASPDVDPEESVNVEFGFRYRTEASSLEVIGFFNDYSNLLGRCRASDPCAGEEFNGGEAEVYGLETNYAFEWILNSDWRVPFQFVYTYTQAEFLTDFDSGFPQWGEVSRGDELPYLPEHQGRVDLGVESDQWSVNLALKHVGQMREFAGSGPYLPGGFTETLTTYDIAIAHQPFESLTLRLAGENLADTREVVSRRPFGARPNLPRTIKASAEYRF